MHPAAMAIKADTSAIVTYDDSKAEVNALMAATTNAGYPSAPRN
jgi:hypothetical protein